MLTGKAEPNKHISNSAQIFVHSSQKIALSRVIFNSLAGTPEARAGVRRIYPSQWINGRWNELVIATLTYDYFFFH